MENEKLQDWQSFIADTLEHFLTTENGKNIVDAIYHLSFSVQENAKAIERLGFGILGDGEVAPTTMGAIELLAKEVKDGLEKISDNI